MPCGPPQKFLTRQIADRVCQIASQTSAKKFGAPKRPATCQIAFWTSEKNLGVPNRRRIAPKFFSELQIRLRSYFALREQRKRGASEGAGSGAAQPAAWRQIRGKSAGREFSGTDLLPAEEKGRRSSAAQPDRHPARAGCGSRCRSVGCPVRRCFGPQVGSSGGRS